MNAVGRLGRHVMMAMGIGRQTADTDESPGTPTVQVALPFGELRAKLPHMQTYGFASRPVAGADHIVMFQNGDRRRGVVIATGDQRYRPTNLAPGEACFYHMSGSRIWFKADGSVLIAPANGKTALTGNLAVSGTITTVGDVVAGTVSIKHHEHTNGNSGGNTGPPIP